MNASNLPLSTVATFNGTHQQQYAYLVLALDQDYEVQSAGAMTDPASSGDFACFIGVVQGGSLTKTLNQWSYFDPGGSAEPPFNPIPAFAAKFGAVLQTLLQDVTEMDGAAVLVNGMVPRWYNRGPHIEKNRFLLVLVDSLVQDATSRSVSVEVIGMPIDPSGYGYLP